MEYWTIINDKHAGPFSADELIEMGLTPQSPVWTSGLPDWVEASEIEELRVKMEQRQQAAQQPAEPQPEQPQPSNPEPQQAGYQEPYQQQGGYQQGQPGGYQQQWGWQQPTPQPQPMQTQPKCPPTYLAWAIIVTLLCCQILGVAAIICSAMTRSAYNRGDLEKATRMSSRTQWLIILAIVLGLISVPFQIITLFF